MAKKVRSLLKELEEAKKLLEDNGYYTSNLWQAYDVTSKFECSEEEAMDVLDMTFENSATYEQIWLSIDVAANELGLKDKEDTNF